MIQGDESCDDGNAVAGDGCTDCMADEGYLCSGEPSVCGVPCDPLLQDCADGDACYLIRSGSICVSAGAGTQGDECMSLDACAPGLVCLDAMNLPGCTGADCCSPLCDLTDPGPVCECVAFYGVGMAPPGYEDVGVCVGE